MSSSASRESSSDRSGEYIVVARRYRPQTFEDLIGQGQVSQALSTAIQTNRVGHAYLFTGARGVGKTSTARIFAKALNCVRGPTPTPCNECDICQSVSTGEDMDVLEIDGASNRGIDEIRQLRSNISIRPSRARFKIYIIDEVHMLTLQAFNALLKTLEEPPEHVKFIFCTTDPEKIPITILSRCQRFDFPPVEAKSIIARLRQIVESEGLTADDEALQLLARRANGSMRDSQSLLEQLLACCSERITAADVHAMLGTARSGQLAALATHLAAGQVAETLQDVDQSLREGVDAGQLAEQLVGYFRDMIAAAVDCGPEMMLHSMVADYPQLRELGRRVGLESLLAMVQILDQVVNRMRYSTHVRTLLEIALVRICKLEHLDDLSSLIAGMRKESGSAAVGAVTKRESSAMSPAASAEKKTTHVPVTVPPAASMPSIPPSPPPLNAAVPTTICQSAQVPKERIRVPKERVPAERIPTEPIAAAPIAAVRPDATGETSNAGDTDLETSSESIAAAPEATSDVRLLSAETIDSVWKQALDILGNDMTAEFARQAERLNFTTPNRLVAHFRAGYILHKEYCERPERRSKLEEALSRVAGQVVRLDLELLPQESAKDSRPQPVQSARQRQREKEQHPLVRRAVEMFDAEVIRVDEPRGS